MIKKLSYVAIAGLTLGLMGCGEKSDTGAASVSALAAQYAETTNPLIKEAVAKIDTLEAKMAEAQKAGFDVTREETVVWFAKEFLKYADWDEANRDAVAYAFEQYQPYKDRAQQLADDIDDYERQEVINIVDAGIAELTQVINGEIKRRAVNKVDWQNIEVAEDMLKSNGKPIFLYDYFSKSVGRPLTDTGVYNDHLGAIFHGGENLYLSLIHI